MTTVRLQIVDAAAAALATATGLTVYRNLDYALDAGNLPALAVVSGDDAPGPDGSFDQAHTEASIDIAVLIANDADPEAAADPYESQIHAAMMTPTGFAGHPVRMERGPGGWAFDLGDCAVRHLNYRVGFWTDRLNLEI